MQLSRSSSSTKDAPSPNSDRDTSSTTRPSPSNETSSPAGAGSGSSSSATLTTSAQAVPPPAASPKAVDVSSSVVPNLPAVDAHGNQIVSVPLDPSALMILQSVDQRGGSPNSFDPARLNLYSNTPLVALSPAIGHPSQPHLVAPGTPVATYSPTNGDWGHQYLQIASLQSMTAAGFLSPAGHPVSPARSPHDDAHRMWPDVSPRLGDMPTSPLTLPIPENGQLSGSHSPSHRPADQSSRGDDLHLDASTADPQTTADGGKYDSGFVGLIPHQGTSPIMHNPYGATWLKGGAAYCMPVAHGGDKVLAAKQLEEHTADLAFPVHPDDERYRPVEAGRMVDTVLHSKSLTEQLLRDFSVEVAVDVLRTALSLLGRPVGAEASVDAQTISGDLIGEPSIVTANGSLPSVKLVHPDEFKNPSTFLKIYGDPLCFTRNGPLPKKGRNGNWECAQCSNVNFPRRFRCNMCGSTRHEEGDRVVSDYARQVYERYLFIYKHQQQMTTDRDPIVTGGVQGSQYSRTGGGSNMGGAGGSYGQSQNRNLHPMHPAHAGAAAPSAGGGGSGGGGYGSQQPNKMMNRSQRQRGSNRNNNNNPNYGAGLIGQQPSGHLSAVPSAVAYSSMMVPHDPYMNPVAMPVNARPQDAYAFSPYG